MELYEKSLRMDLNEHIKNNINYSEEFLMTTFYTLLTTLNDLKTNFNLYHRDIKPANLFLKQDKIFIADFGTSKIQDFR